MAEETSAVAAASLLLPEASACGLVLPAATLAGTAAAVEATGAAVGGALAVRGGGGAGARRMGGFRWLLVLRNSANADIQYKTCLHANDTEDGNSWTANVLVSEMECIVIVFS